MHQEVKNERVVARLSSDKTGEKIQHKDDPALPLCAKGHVVSQLEYATWKCGRVVDCTGLENRQTERFRGFESYHFRQIKPLSD
jgi:hypothetical protein